tara:strand:+ start:196 stop:297 length:102 start_codon:yes stop_codon:yes gene_type:complete
MTMQMTMYRQRFFYLPEHNENPGAIAAHLNGER